MATAKKLDQPRRKATGKTLTFASVCRAAQDGQKAFDAYVATGKLPVKK
ncbi:hypothetical protein [Azotobacter beijerinckii]|uniref:Uncharacterized protein n=1 Tax=Azotobacter beijerinckii TaxID=170623 RepID=A0A1I0ZXD7_9GAMM|nr:hypothetical protein [Azotobacter beijerinckii]SFB30369.1 hypothetical protein SAMN04244571_02162 [Azotobacter beijerinckii]